MGSSKVVTWLIRLSRGLPSDPTRQVRSCGIHANHWMGGTPMQYLSTASASVFLSSKLSSHNTYRWKETTKKTNNKLEVLTAEETSEKKTRQYKNNK